jgi:hypothetical protein
MSQLDSFLNSKDNFLVPEAMNLNLSTISAVEDPLSDSLPVMETSLVKDDKNTAKVLIKPSKKAATVAVVANIHRHCDLRLDQALPSEILVPPSDDAFKALWDVL